MNNGIINITLKKTVIPTISSSKTKEDQQKLISNKNKKLTINSSKAVSKINSPNASENISVNQSKKNSIEKIQRTDDELIDKNHETDIENIEVKSNETLPSAEKKTLDNSAPNSSQNQEHFNMKDQTTIQNCLILQNNLNNEGNNSKKKTIKVRVPDYSSNNIPSFSLSKDLIKKNISPQFYTKDRKCSYNDSQPIPDFYISTQNTYDNTVESMGYTGKENDIIPIENVKSVKSNLSSRINNDVIPISKKYHPSGVKINSETSDFMEQNSIKQNINHTKYEELKQKGGFMPVKQITLARGPQVSQVNTKRSSTYAMIDIVPMPNIISNAPHTFVNTCVSLNNNIKTGDSKKDQNKNIDGYIIEKIIGSGSYAVVRIATDDTTKIKYAIKTYDKYKLYDLNKRKNIRREISILSGLEHNNIIKLHRTLDTPTQIHLVMEYIGNTSLYHYLKTKPNKRLEENEARFIFKQIADGLAYCHRKNLCHRDIKLENILLGENNIVKIIDFGFSVETIPNKTLNLICGTLCYMAPELVNKQEYCGHLVDSWALGVMLFVLLIGKFPFQGSDDKETGKKITKGAYEISTDLSIEVQILIEKLLRINPTTRASVEDILNDNWVNGREQSYRFLGNFLSDKIKECKDYQKNTVTENSNI